MKAAGAFINPNAWSQNLGKQHVTWEWMICSFWEFSLKFATNFTRIVAIIRDKSCKFPLLPFISAKQLQTWANSSSAAEILRRSLSAVIDMYVAPSISQTYFYARTVVIRAASLSQSGNIIHPQLACHTDRTSFIKTHIINCASLATSGTSERSLQGAVLRDVDALHLLQASVGTSKNPAWHRLVSFPWKRRGILRFSQPCARSEISLKHKRPSPQLVQTCIDGITSNWYWLVGSGTIIYVSDQVQCIPWDCIMLGIILPVLYGLSTSTTHVEWRRFPARALLGVWIWRWLSKWNIPHDFSSQQWSKAELCTLAVPEKIQNKQQTSQTLLSSAKGSCGSAFHSALTMWPS